MKIGILNAYHFEKHPNTYQKAYAPMIKDYLTKYFNEFEFVEYMVAHDEFPADTKECDGYIVTGSPASCYEDEIWIKDLIQFVQDCHEVKQRMVGICFGHQLIAHALGGKVERSPKGWGIGVHDFAINKHTSWMSGEQKSCSLLFFHQDQVVELPKDATLLAQSDFCPIQVYSIEKHVFCFQGHPEFTRDYSKFRIEANKEVIAKETFDEALKNIDDPTDEDVFAAWVKNFFIGS